MAASLLFSGPATRLTAADFAAVARDLGVDVAAIEAVTTVESGDGCGFLGDGTGRPKIRFEARVFGDDTGHRFDASHPLLSCRLPNWKLSLAGAAEYGRLYAAMALDRVAALEATSWGMFQIMGANFEMLGFAHVEEMVGAFVAGERQQLDAFATYCTQRHLVPLLRDKEWARFAALYNGPDYQLNDYATKLATAYLMAQGHLSAGMTLGSQGQDVAALQAALTACGQDLVADGMFGPATELAVRRFQSSRGLPVDGIPGAATLAALGLHLLYR